MEVIDVVFFLVQNRNFSLCRKGNFSHCVDIYFTPQFVVAALLSTEIVFLFEIIFLRWLRDVLEQCIEFVILFLENWSEKYWTV